MIGNIWALLVMTSFHWDLRVVVTCCGFGYTFSTMKQYYLETDGRVFLLRRNGKYVFPSRREEVPFSFTEMKTISLGEHEIIYCEPVLEDHPSDWVHKEDVPLRDDVDRVVRKAINYSLPRIVVEGITRNEAGEVLMVKPSRGYNKDSWTLPGGFLVYGESPEEAILRETAEEISVEPAISELVYVYSAIGEENSYQWLVFFFRVELPENGEIKPSHEIVETRWFPPEKAPTAINSPVMREGFKRACQK